VPIRLALCLVALTFATACATQSQSSRRASQVTAEDEDDGSSVDMPEDGRVVRSSQLGSPAGARLKGVLKNHQHEERAPAQLLRAEIEEEATLTRFDRRQVCFDLVARTIAGDDKPLAEWEYLLNDEDVPKYEVEFQADETVEVHEFDYTVDRDVLVARGLTHLGPAALRITEPEKRTLRIVERRAPICMSGKLVRGNVVTLEVKLPQRPGQSMWKVFGWKVVRDAPARAAATPPPSAPEAVIPPSL
jgi:hypothetical protein